MEIIKITSDKIYGDIDNSKILNNKITNLEFEVIDESITPQSYIETRGLQKDQLYPVEYGEDGEIIKDVSPILARNEYGERTQIPYWNPSYDTDKAIFYPKATSQDKQYHKFFNGKTSLSSSSSIKCSEIGMNIWYSSVTIKAPISKEEFPLSYRFVDVNLPVQKTHKLTLSSNHSISLNDLSAYDETQSVSIENPILINNFALVWETNESGTIQIDEKNGTLIESLIEVQSNELKEGVKNDDLYIKLIDGEKNLSNQLKKYNVSYNFDKPQNENEFSITIPIIVGWSSYGVGIQAVPKINYPDEPLDITKYDGFLKETIFESLTLQIETKSNLYKFEVKTEKLNDFVSPTKLLLEKNSYIQHENLPQIKSNYNNIVKKYENGKEIAIFSCSISDYYDLESNLAISKTSPSKPMVFKLYDKVIPFYRSGNFNSRPLGMNDDGTVKVYEVIDAQIVGDGAIFQNLVVQECGNTPPLKDATPSLIYEISNDNTYYICVGSTDKTISNIVIGSAVNGIPVEEIKYEAFSYYQGYNNIESLIISNSVKTIGLSAFMGSETLKYISLGTSLKTLSNDVFANCSGMKQIQFNSTLMNDLIVRNGIFENAGKNGEGIYVTFGKNVERVPSYLFNSTNSTNTNPKILKVVFEPNSRCESIGEYAFAYCKDLTSVEIPSSVNKIEDRAYVGLTSLSQVHIKDIAKWCDIDFENVYSSPVYYSEQIYLNGKLVEQLVIPNTVNKIKSIAFYWCVSLTSLTIPNSVTSIGSNAFSSCTALTNIIMGKNVTYIGISAFSNCRQISDVYYMGSERDWASISIESGNTYLTNATRYYYSETEPTIEGNYWHYVNGEVTVWANPNSVAMYSRIAPKPTPKRYTTEEGIGIEEYDYNTILYRYKGGESNLVLPRYLNYKQYQIGDFAFAENHTIEAISIPTSVTYIGESAFENCANLKDVYYEGTRSQWNNIYVGNGNEALLTANIHFNSFIS